MKAWLLNGVTDLSQTNSPLVLGEILLPVPKGHQVLIKVSCCGVCHTPVWKTVLSALSHLRPGGRLVINAIFWVRIPIFWQINYSRDFKKKHDKI
ncbi:MAG: hypothetical protein ACXIUQ_10270 [Cecembia sp.]